ncbi:hypothetical protein LPTSP4_12850 [Leptospira ryugenii]|uniref:Concanavalin A-like lectin/glucanases family protein n=1 Tax=Leptospira ryugenii TaxID=1917863 RepID=A0A2P2DYS8_9LEPT|nr:concanavalin A-like lectin/glucanase [Leptospira ryugenii]GBF49766.1 hypothetical protein LPTSP4_12850 [Leptospira ryugenii]
MDSNKFRGWTTRTALATYRGSKALAICIILSFSLEAKEIIREYQSQFADWKRKSAEYEQGISGNQSLKPSENRPKNPELFLDFEEDKNEKLSRAISILSSSFIPDPKHSLYGKRSAYFSGKRNQIHLNVSGSHFFGQNPESFTITLPLLINEQGAYSNVLDKTVLIQGQSYGFRLEIVEAKPVLSLHQMIKKLDGSYITVTIRSNKIIPRKEWHILSLYFDTKKNQILMFQNGFETARYEAPKAAVDHIGFHEDDSNALILAKSYFGNIDGFHIHAGEPFGDGKYSRYESAQYSDDTKRVQHEGSFITSPVFETTYSHSTLDFVQLHRQSPKDTNVGLYFRSSLQKFSDKENVGPTWKPIDLTKVKWTDTNRFRYYQWKIWLRPDPIGSTAPSVSQLTYQLKELIPPDVPSFFRVNKMEGEPLGVCFLWNSNHEREVQNQGGYMIHFGPHPDRMIGTLFVKSKDNKLINIDGRDEAADYKNLKFCANERTLLENIYIPDQSVTELPNTVSDPVFTSRMERKGHLFQSGITYYFRISAYNQFYNEWEGRDQKSKLSAPVSLSFDREISQR